MTSPDIEQLLTDIAEDLTSGAAELALRAITIYRHIISSDLHSKNLNSVRSEMVEVSRQLIKSQPAMAPLFNLANEILFATDGAKNLDELAACTIKTADQFENRLCNSAASIAQASSKLVPFGETVFAYSFSSTVVSALLNAKQQKPFRVVCTESRPSLEGRKLANMLASAGVEVTFTFDSAMGLLLPNCRVAFMGVDAVARPGIVNKVGSWLLTLACRELKIPVFALAGTEKFVSDDLLFSFEDHERPGNEVWDAPPQGVRAINRQFELIPFDWIAGLVTEEGILRSEQDVEPFVDRIKLHPELQSYAMSH